jgi:hypothetical protein
MSLYFKTHILYCRRPERIQRFLIELFEAELKEHADFFEMRLLNQHFILKELPNSSLNDDFVVQLNQSFCLGTTDRQELNDLEERFQFFQFKENSRAEYVRPIKTSKEKIQRIQNTNSDGVLIFDDDGRSWTLMYDKTVQNSLALNDDLSIDGLGL